MNAFLIILFCVELILCLNCVMRSNRKEGIYVVVHLCSVHDDPAACLFKFFSLLGHFHLPFHMINVATRVTMVTGNGNPASMPVKAFGPVDTPRAAK